MSMAALLQATRDHLRTQLSLDKDRCDVRPGGRPIPSMGEFYYAVDSGGTDNDALEYLHETYRAIVTVTIRTGQFPKDRQGSIYLTATSGLEARVRAAMVKIHRNYALMTAANTLITGTVNKFQKPLRYEGVDPPSFESAEWAYSVNDQDSFIVQRIRFGGALRVQAVDIMT